MRTGWKIALLLFSLLLCGAKQTLAQESGNAQQEADSKQARMNELRAQMAEIQSELDALSGAKPLQNGIVGSPPAPPPPPPSHLSPEQQLEAEGKATEEHHTFSQDEAAAPRLFNAPPKSPSKAFLPQHTRYRKNPTN